MSLQKLMALMNPREEEEEEEEDLSRMQTDVTDEEMALRYELFPSDAEALRVPTVAHYRHTHTHTVREARLSSAVFLGRYESLVGSMKKKFATKRERVAQEADEENHEVAKRAFVKPQD